MSISMYFGVSWIDPRLQINATAPEWTEARTGPKDVRTFSLSLLTVSGLLFHIFISFIGSKRFSREFKVHVVS